MKIWHSRGYLPHFEAGHVPQFITFRLVDSLPRHVFERWEEELSKLQRSDARAEMARRVERYLDEATDNQLLARLGAGEIVEDALLFYDGTRYTLHAWVVMPSHVHAVVSPSEGMTLSKLLGNWKGYTSHSLNDVLGRKGPVWQPDYFDQVIRNEDHFYSVVEYVHLNPVKAGLCARASEWRFSSAFGDRWRGFALGDERAPGES